MSSSLLPPHPLQPALDRASRALYTAVDLLEIAQHRKKPGGRSDARQSSLYRATVSASVAALEEGTEALVVEFMRSQGLSLRGMLAIEASMATLMQNPQPEQVRKVVEGFTGFDPIPSWRVHLSTSAPAFRKPEQIGGQTAHRLWTIYNQDRIWNGDEAADVWSRFVKIRNSFAHQDASVAIMTKSQIGIVRQRLSAQKATAPADIEFVERLNATCAVRAVTTSNASADPVQDWRLHETHAVNSLLCAVGLIASMTDGLANHMATNTAYVPLTLKVERGKWVEHAGPLAKSSCNLPWLLAPYTPGQR